MAGVSTISASMPAARGAAAPAQAAGTPVAPGLGADRLDLSARAYPAQAAAPVRAQGLVPGWVSLVTFAGIWGIWGFPAALLGAAGIWAVNKLSGSLS